MAVTKAQLAAYIGAADQDGTISPENDAELTRVSVLANALVDQTFAKAWRPVPDAVKDQVFLDTATNLYRRGATGDGGNMLAADGTPVVGVANDPLRKSWDLIKRYINRV